MEQRFIVACLSALLVLTGCGRDVRCGKTESGDVVSFVRSEAGTFGVRLVRADGDGLEQLAPARLLLCADGKTLSSQEAGYRSVRRSGGEVEALAEIAAGGSVFSFRDLWRVDGDALYLDRTVTVANTVEGTGFCTEAGLETSPDVQWQDRKFFLPGVIYGEPHTTARAKGGSQFHDAGFFSLREDYLSAPLAAVVDDNFGWFGLLNCKPDGATTWEETTAPANVAVIDPSLGFGTIEIAMKERGGIGLSFLYPGTCREFAGGSPWDRNAASTVIERIRLHPVEEGFSHQYSLAFLLGHSGSMPGVERDAWRYAWSVLDPKVEKVDLNQVRTTLLDHLADRVIENGDLVGVPFVIDAKTGKPGSFRPAVRAYPSRGNTLPYLKEMQSWAKGLGIEIDPAAAELDIWEYAVLGFCGKHVEIAEQFLLESYRDDSPRGARFRQLAEEIMGTLVKYAPVDPPVGEGINLRTGKAGNIHGGNTFGLRPIPEDMARLMDLLEREKERGYEHPDWLDWGRRFADWLLTQQRPDGSFPDGWDDDGQVSDEAGAMSYSPIPMYLGLAVQTGDNRYFDAAVNAGEYLWDEFGVNGVYQGATGTSAVADKESGMLSAEAFLALYKATDDGKWLERAAAAADYAETWIWIWNVPMPGGADAAELGWKPGVPTIGVNGIGSNDVGGVDQYLDWAVPIYAKLYKYTGDEHYLEVARVLLHGTKAMLALPGRTYDMAGPGWQQEHWRMGPVRGIGAHRTWLPWISINHLHGITALEEFDKDIYDELK